MQRSRLAAVALGPLCAMTMTGTAAAAADSGRSAPVRVDIEPGRGIVVTPDDYWYIRGTFSFTVSVTDVGEDNDENLFAFVSVPDEIRMVGYEGERWECAAVEGGVDCSNPDLVVPGEAWPLLTITATGTGYVQDTLDVHAIADSDEWTQTGTPFVYDTSS
ncbi:hypothetical protein [Umezawaea sp. Da 62-37]|uniref:hypothetical protein n=1 Tax=Umezawaea sp. Da 62-37 TaxID=3075927 RepID=UPI0028F6E41E|nr:hypothetical protein [Umezawaea sp. Da 62-37]WNV88354.1 hypothetical protein RM788_08675 [Umezawaea sp. Da 62-37]